jgi:hypothetical protein
VRKKIGECLIQAGLITGEDLQTALAEHKRTGERVGAVLVRLNFATEKQITKVLAYQLGFPYVSLTEEPPEQAAITLIPKEMAIERVCVAVTLEKNLLTVAMSDPLLCSLVHDLEFQTGYRIKQVVATRSDILKSIERGYADKALATDTGGGASGALMRRTDDDFNACPHCGQRLSGGCPECARALQPDWSFCPFCAATAVPQRARKRVTEQKTRELPGSNAAEFKSQHP